MPAPHRRLPQTRLLPLFAAVALIGSALVGCSSGSGDGNTASRSASTKSSPSKAKKPPAKLSGADATRASKASDDLAKAVEAAHQTLDAQPTDALHDQAAQAIVLLRKALHGAPANAPIPNSNGADAERLLLDAKAFVEPYWRDLADNASSTISSLADLRGGDPGLLASMVGDACRRADKPTRQDFPPGSDPAGNIKLLDKQAGALQRALTTLERLQAPTAKRADFNDLKSVFATRVKLAYADTATYRSATIAASPEGYQAALGRYRQVESALQENEKKLLIASDKLDADGCGFL